MRWVVVMLALVAVYQQIILEAHRQTIQVALNQSTHAVSVAEAQKMVVRRLLRAGRYRVGVAELMAKAQ